MSTNDREQTSRSRDRRLRVDPRPRTMSPAALRRWRRHIGRAASADHPRPATRADCRTGPRPCPYVGCRHHLYLETKPTGAITVSWPHLEPWEIPETCALDVAECGQHTLDEIGDLLNLSWERVRKIEKVALSQLQEDYGDELAFAANGVGR